MPQYEVNASSPPCASSSLHQPEEVNGVFNSERMGNIPGNCMSAAQALNELGLPHAMIENCPKLLEDYKAKGAPQSATCIAELMLFANVTNQ